MGWVARCRVLRTCLLERFSETGDTQQSQNSQSQRRSYLSPHVSLVTWENIECNCRLNVSHLGQRGLPLSPSCCQSLSGGRHKISFMAKIIPTGPNTTLQSRRQLQSYTYNSLLLVTMTKQVWF